MKIVETVNSPLKLVSKEFTLPKLVPKEFTCPNPTWRQENRIEVRSYKYAIVNQLSSWLYAVFHTKSIPKVKAFFFFFI